MVVAGENEEEAAQNAMLRRLKRLEQQNSHTTPLMKVHAGWSSGQSLHADQGSEITASLPSNLHIAYSYHSAHTL